MGSRRKNKIRSRGLRRSEERKDVKRQEEEEEEEKDTSDRKGIPFIIGAP